MAAMNERDQACFEHFMKAYKHQYDLNQYFRTQYDEDLEFYLSYRDGGDYPYAFNVFFNMLLPRIFTVLSRFMEQIYQAGTSNLVSVRARKSRDVDRAPRVEGLLNYQLDTLNELEQSGGGYMFNMKWMLHALSWGKGVAKVMWKKEERITPKRSVIPIPQFTPDGSQFLGWDWMDYVEEMPQIVYDAPYAEVLHPKLFVPHPHYKDIQRMPFVFCVYQRSIDYIRTMQEQGVYRNVDNLSWADSSPSGFSGNYGEDAGEAFAKSIGLEGADYPSDFSSELSTPNVDIVEGYGRYIFPEDEVPYEVGSGYQIKGKESDAICHIANYKTLLRIEKNTYGQKPFFDISGYHHPELYWDIGLIRLGKGIQHQINNLGNVRYQNAIQLVNQMLKVREDADIPEESLIWKPFGIIPVEQMDDVEPLSVPDVSQSMVFKEQEEFFEKVLSDMTGMYPYGMGQTPPRQEHVGTMYSLQSMGEARTKLLLMTMDYQGFKPFLKHMMILNAWHLPGDFELRIGDPGDGNFTELFPNDIHPDYDFTARYTAMEPALGKQFRAQQLQMYAQMWADSPYLQHHQFMKAILEMMDFHDIERYVKSPEQVQQEQQQQMMQQMQMQTMAMTQQDQMAAKQSERDMGRDAVKALLR